MLQMKRLFTNSARTRGAGKVHGSCAERLMLSCMQWQSSGSWGQTIGRTQRLHPSCGCPTWKATRMGTLAALCMGGAEQTIP